MPKPMPLPTKPLPLTRPQHPHRRQLNPATPHSTTTQSLAEVKILRWLGTTSSQNQLLHAFKFLPSFLTHCLHPHELPKRWESSAFPIPMASTARWLKTYLPGTCWSMPATLPIVATRLKSKIFVNGWPACPTHIKFWFVEIMTLRATKTITMAQPRMDKHPGKDFTTTVKTMTSPPDGRYGKLKISYIWKMRVSWSTAIHFMVLLGNPNSVTGPSI